FPAITLQGLPMTLKVTATQSSQLLTGNVFELMPVDLRPRLCKQQPAITFRFCLPLLKPQFIEPLDQGEKRVLPTNRQFTVGFYMALQSQARPTLTRHLARLAVDIN